jgi:2-keto-4-pentenoate hydratase
MERISGARETQLFEALNLLLEARRTGIPIADLPLELEPKDLDEALLIQGQMMLAYGEIGGWKIGAATPDGTPLFAPMPSAWIASGGAELFGQRYRGVEAEVAFLLAQDLPPRATPYTSAEVYAAVASCHPAIEILGSAYVDPEQVPKLNVTADLQMHGGFIFGPACPDWRAIDFSIEQVALAVDGAVRVERTGSNPAGDLLRLLPFLANHGAARTGGLRAGQWITTGSWTGNVQAGALSSVDVHFSTLGRVTARFL